MPGRMPQPERNPQERHLVGLRHRLAELGLESGWMVIARMPVRGYALLIAVPLLLVDVIVIVSAPRITVAAVMLAMTGSIVAASVAWARSYIALMGENWLATHGLFRWKVVKLEQLTRLRAYSGGAMQLWVHIYDSDGGHVALSGRSTIPRIRPYLLRWAEEAASQDRLRVDRTCRSLLGLSP